jgi:mersacidin/lichenicidin family type 2 lantibiotic
MSKKQIVAAWKNPQFRASLTQAQRDDLPASPAGIVELTDEFMKGIDAADDWGAGSNWGCSCGQTSCYIDE